MKKVRLGIIGLGARGTSMLKNVIIHFSDVDIVALCDIYADRVERASKLVLEKRGKEPFGTLDYNEVLSMDGIDAVYIASDWESHMEISVAALRKGVICASEVGGAYTLEECFELVRAYEETGTPYMLMENCCFNDAELLATAAVRRGMLGRRHNDT